jgi:hypothetical protein
MILMFVLILAYGLCCAWFYNLPCVGAGVVRYGLDTYEYIDWVQLNRLHLKTETESSLRNLVCFK